MLTPSTKPAQDARRPQVAASNCKSIFGQLPKSRPAPSTTGRPKCYVRGMLMKTTPAAKPKALNRVMYSKYKGCDHVGRTVLGDPFEAGRAFCDGESLVLEFDFDIRRGLCEGRLVLEPLAAADALTG
jgi:hypothetical protein